MATPEQQVEEKLEVAEAAAATGPAHGGIHVARALKSRGVDKLFTLSGGHLFSIYDGCKTEAIEVIDTRHEQSAAFAADGFAKATRRPGVCALTAGPGVTNGMSAIAGAKFNNSPLVVLGGRAPEMRWGSGSLQEIDHVPFVAPLVKSAETVKETSRIGEVTAAAIDRAVEGPGGPTFVDYPLDVVFNEAEAEVPGPRDSAAVVASGVEEAAALLAGAERPAIMAGTNLYWGRGEDELRSLAEALGIPVFLNGMGRGCLPADHELCFSRARGAGLKGADVALVIGVPLDFRLGFGGSFGEETKIVQLDFAASELDGMRRADLELVGDIAATMAALRESAGRDPSKTSGWVSELRGVEDEKRAGEEAEFNDDRAPLHPMRIYRELREILDRDAIVIGDGGDFVSYAGRVMESHSPGVLDGPRAVRLPGRGAGPGDRGEDRAPGAAGLPVAGRWRFRVLRDGVRHDGPARAADRRGDGEQRDLGTRGAPDADALRLLDRGEAAAGDAVRPDGRVAWGARGAGAGAGGAAGGAGAGVC